MPGARPARCYSLTAGHSVPCAYDRFVNCTADAEYLLLRQSNRSKCAIRSAQQQSHARVLMQNRPNGAIRIAMGVQRGRGLGHGPDAPCSVPCLKGERLPCANTTTLPSRIAECKPV